MQPPVAGAFPAYGTRNAGLPPPATTARALRHAALRQRLDCRFDAVDAVFDDCADEALASLSPAGMDAWIAAARSIGKLGRGVEPLLVFLQIWPTVATLAGEAALAPVMDAVQALQKSPNGTAIAPLLQSLGAAARRLRSAEAMAQYLALAVDLMRRTSVSIHGRHATGPSPSLPTFVERAPALLAQVPLAGLRRWVDAGIRLHGTHPQRQVEFFALASADSRALLQRQRQGLLLVDAERRIELTLRALCDEPLAVVPYPVALFDDGGADAVRRPYLDGDGLRLPEVLADRPGARALDRWRAMAAHAAGHRRWSRPLVADNLSPLQRMAVECFEDARIDHLLLRRWPGLAPRLRALHPTPGEDGCDPVRESCLRHRLACLSRALLDPAQDPAHPYTGSVLLEFVAAFHAELAGGAESSTAAMRALALQWAARTRRQSDQLASVYFKDTEVDWRDDNRHLWTFIEAGDEEDGAPDPARRDDVEPAGLPPRHYPEWDAAAAEYRADWTSVYDILQPAGDAAAIEALLQHHARDARHLKRLLELLKPQDRTRLRRQEQGSELDLDAAIRSLADWRAGSQPDPRVHASTRSDGRDIAVLLLLDLSQSVNDRLPGSDETVLSTSRAAVALLAQAISATGDPLAIAGFHSNTRHGVSYLHIKGFAEPWDDAPKARLAGARGAYSTRIGAALRHAGRLLAGRKADKRLLLLLTDGQPSDVDVSDPEHLRADAAQAVRELARDGVYCHCISVDPQADAYVGRIFGARFTVVDRVEQLPRRLPEVFLGLTR